MESAEPNQPAMSDDPEILAGRSLPLLRAMIDTIDHEVLHLLSRRNGLIAEVAAFKRANNVPIRDYVREREIILDRRERAANLGLSPDAIESMYRLVLWASRDRQAALKAEVPKDIEPKSVAIIGGQGAMGSLMRRLFVDLGHPVLIADVDTPLSCQEAASIADVVVISVPIDVTVQVIKELGPFVRDESLMIDITSIKDEPMKAMLASTKASVIGTHPLFGPSVHTVQGQRIVLTPGRGDKWLVWLKQMLRARGLEVMESTPENHDSAMAVVQVLTHFSTEVMGQTLAQLNIPIEETLQFTSPVYLMELLMTARHFAQSPNLYASIQMSNPVREEITQTFTEVAEKLSRVVSNKDQKAFVDMFQKAQSYFGPFTDRAIEQSSFLIDRLVERA